MTFSRIGGTVNRTIYDQQGSTSQTPGKVVRRDGQGLPFLGLVNYGSNYDNAFWDNAGHMFFGDGDGKLLTETTAGIDVIGHELTHGVTQHEANLVYSRALRSAERVNLGCLRKSRSSSWPSALT